MTEWTVAIGVDTHKQWHVAVALDRLGRSARQPLRSRRRAAGYRQLLVVGAWSLASRCLRSRARAAMALVSLRFLA